jgi:hypothetical protein
MRERSEFFDSTPFLKAKDVKDGGKFIIESFDAVKTRLGPKLYPLLRLKDWEEPFGLNATNYDKMVELFGPDQKKWAGKKIKLVKVKAPNPSKGGQIGDALRIA